MQITSTIYIPTQGRLVCGREDGSIVIVPAIQAMTLLLLSTIKSKGDCILMHLLKIFTCDVTVYPSTKCTIFRRSGMCFFTKYISDSLPRQVLHGHNGRVNCLLYPLNDSSRYDPNHLVSGGMDFTVVLWDISNGTKLHTFSVHGGEIMQLLVPPENCNVS